MRRHILDLVENSCKSLNYRVNDNRPIVILGRDAWPMVPFMRYHWPKRKIQYFLFSRLQFTSKATRKVWLEEVFPDSVVVDTGFEGSILKHVLHIDPYINEGMLIQSDNPDIQSLYFTHVSNSTLRKWVLELEHLPKIINRTVSYDANNNALCTNICDNDDNIEEFAGRSAEVINYLFLKELGLPQDWCSKYARFTGITPEERLGIDKYQYREHRLQVRQARRKLDSFSRLPLDKLIKSAHLYENFDFVSYVIANRDIPREWILHILQRYEKKLKRKDADEHNRWRWELKIRFCKQLLRVKTERSQYIPSDIPEYY